MENGDRHFVIYLGDKVRKLRKEQHLTQLDLARQVGITNGQISTIERGVSSPSISTLHQISSALGVPMSEFFQDEPARHTYLVRKGSGRRLPGTGGNVRMDLLTQAGKKSGFSGMLVELTEGEMKIAPRPTSSDEYFLYVLRGKCTLSVEGETHEMEAQDSIYVKARREQVIRNTGTGPFQALIVSQSTLVGSEVRSGSGES